MAILPPCTALFLNISPTDICECSWWHLCPVHNCFSTVICECNLKTGQLVQPHVGFPHSVCLSSATLNPHKPIPISASVATSFLHWTSLYVSASRYYPAGQLVYTHVGRPSCDFDFHLSCDIDFRQGQPIHPRQPVKHYHTLHMVRLPHSAHASSTTLCTWSNPNLAATVCLVIDFLSN